MHGSSAEEEVPLQLKLDIEPQPQYGHVLIQLAVLWSADPRSGKGNKFTSFTLKMSFYDLQLRGKQFQIYMAFPSPSPNDPNSLEIVWGGG